MIAIPTDRHCASGRARMVCASLMLVEQLERRALLSTGPVVINGVQPVALDTPNIHGILYDNGTLLTGLDSDGNPGYYDIQGYLDTGTSGVLLDSDTAAAWGVTPATYNGQTVTYNDTGVAGGEGFSVSNPLDISLAYSTAADDTRGNIDGLDLGNPPPDLSAYTQSTNNIRIQISRDAVDPDVGGIDIFGTSVLQNKVVVMDPTPLDEGGFFGGSTMSTFVYNPGTPYNAAERSTDPGIPTTNLHVKLSSASFNQFTSISPDGAPGPNEDNNPFIGPNPVAAMMPHAPVDNTPPVTMTEGSNTATGSFLFDTGGQVSFISQAEANKLGVYYAPGTYNSDNPDLVDGQGDDIDNQFSIPIEGIGGTVNAAGFFMSSLSLPTVEGPPITFLNAAPVLVIDVSVTNPVTQKSLTLDGDFGMNFLVRSTSADETQDNPGPFDWLTYNQANGLLGIDVPNLTVTPWPTAGGSATDVIGAGASSYTFTVNYAATSGQTISPASIGSSNVLVTGPHGFSQLATEVSANLTNGGSTDAVTYRITPPGGAWSIGDDGDYNISMQPNQVGDSAGDFVKSGTLAGFSVAIAPTSIPSSNSGQTYYVQDDPNSIYTQLFINTPNTGDPTYLFSPSALSTLTINGGSGNDSVTVDFSNGDPLPTNGLSFNGGAGTNSLTIIGSYNNDSFAIDDSQVSDGDATMEYANTQSIMINGASSNDTLEQTAQPNASVSFGGQGQNTLIVDTGIYTFPADPILNTNTLSVFDYGTVVVNAASADSGVTPVTLAGLNIGPNATVTAQTAVSHADRTVLVLGSLTESNTSTLDMGGNDLIVQSGSLAVIYGHLRSGFNLSKGGYWNGKGIISSVAATDPTHLTTLGVLLNSDANGNPIYTTFDGQGVSANDILVKCTYYGDANLSGTVDGTDYSLIDAGYGSAGTLGGWNNGDFNYDAKIDGSDYTLLDNAYNMQGASLAATVAEEIAPAAMPPLSADVRSIMAAPVPPSDIPVAGAVSGVPLFSNNAPINFDSSATAIVDAGDLKHKDRWHY